MTLKTMMDDWDSLKIVLALSRERTIKGAADSLGLNPTTVSRRIERMSKEFGDTVFVRKDGQWKTTELGDHLAELAARVQSEMTSAFLELERPNLETRQIVISLDRHFQDLYLMPMLGPFVREHPEICVKVVNKPLSIGLGEAELVMGHEEPQEGRIVRQNLGYMHLRIFEPEVGEPRGWVRVASSLPCNLEESLEDFFSEPARVTFECWQYAAQIAAREGYACVLPTLLQHRFVGLRPSTALIDTVDIPVWLSYHEARRQDRSLRDFRERIEATARSHLSHEG